MVTFKCPLDTILTPGWSLNEVYIMLACSLWRTVLSTLANLRKFRLWVGSVIPWVWVLDYIRRENKLTTSMMHLFSLILAVDVTSYFMCPQWWTVTWSWEVEDLLSPLSCFHKAFIIATEIRRGYIQIQPESKEISRYLYRTKEKNLFMSLQ